jgi:hypothetical protein
VSLPSIDSTDVLKLSFDAAASAKNIVFKNGNTCFEDQNNIVYGLQTRLWNGEILTQGTHNLQG